MTDGIEIDGHGRRVGALSFCTAVALGSPLDEADEIGEAARLHDVGKRALPAGLVDRPGRLHPAEFEIVKAHTVLGARILRGPGLELARTIARYHHERWNGSGYEGLVGYDIPLGARIAGLVDVYDALTNDRPYRPSWGRMEARDEVEAGAGTLFDPDVVEAFLTTIPVPRVRAIA